MGSGGNSDIGSVVVCMTCKWEIMGLITSWAELCWDVVRLGKALCSHVHSIDPGVSGHLVGQWGLCQNGSRAGCSRGSWDGLWMNGSCDQGVIVCSQVSDASHQIPDHKPPPLHVFYLDLGKESLGQLHADHQHQDEGCTKPVCSVAEIPGPCMLTKSIDSTPSTCATSGGFWGSLGKTMSPTGMSWPRPECQACLLCCHKGACAGLAMSAAYRTDGSPRICYTVSLQLAPDL